MPKSSQKLSGFGLAAGQDPASVCRRLKAERLTLSPGQKLSERKKLHGILCSLQISYWIRLVNKREQSRSHLRQLDEERDIFF
jgi:hypothetical protein